ncbi:MAG: hypothetical protein ACKOWP_02330 [Microbacteriaceae bacterium]
MSENASDTRAGERRALRLRLWGILLIVAAVAVVAWPVTAMIMVGEEDSTSATMLAGAISWTLIPAIGVAGILSTVGATMIVRSVVGKKIPSSTETLRVETGNSSLSEHIDRLRAIRATAIGLATAGAILTISTGEILLLQSQPFAELVGFQIIVGTPIPFGLWIGINSLRMIRRSTNAYVSLGRAFLVSFLVLLCISGYGLHGLGFIGALGCAIGAVDYWMWKRSLKTT